MATLSWWAVIRLRSSNTCPSAVPARPPTETGGGEDTFAGRLEADRKSNAMSDPDAEMGEPVSVVSHETYPGFRRGTLFANSLVFINYRPGPLITIPRTLVP